MLKATDYYANLKVCFPSSLRFIGIAVYRETKLLGSLKAPHFQQTKKEFSFFLPFLKYIQIISIML